MASKLISLKGGLDLSANKNERLAGTAKEALNVYESSTGGYTNVRGYERFDGKFSPSAATYYIAKFEKWSAKTVSDLSGSITLRGHSLSVLRVLEETANDTATLLLTAIGLNELDFTGTSSELGGADLVEFSEGAAENRELDSYFKAIAQDFYRLKIERPEGSGPIRGVAQSDSEVLAWRDSLDGTRLDAFKSTGTGWEQVNWAQIVSAPKAINVNDGSVLNSGDYKVLGVYPFINNEGVRDIEKNVYALLKLKDTAAPLTVGLTLTPEVSGSTIGNIEELIAFTPKPAGKVRTYLHNFYASDSTRNIYAVDGKNCAYTYLCQRRCLSSFCLQHAETRRHLHTRHCSRFKALACN